MVDWKSSADVTKDNLAFNRLIHVLLGVYVWEWMISLGFDWKLISGKKPFKWPMIFYFLNRYTLLFALIGMIIALNVTAKIDCQTLWAFNQVLAGTAFGCASINLSLRTMAVWSRKWYIVFPLIVLIIGHFGAMLHGILLKAEWRPGQGCVIIYTDIKSFAAGHIYTMTFDFIVMSLTAIKLVLPSSGNRSRLVQLIFQDGLIYFILTFLSNLLVTIFVLLDLNPIMSIIANFPALGVSTIAACRVVRRLSNFSSANPEIFLPSAKGSSLAFLSHTSGIPNVAIKNVPKEGVHVQTETFQTSAKAVYPAHSQLISGAFDCEAQVRFKSLS